MSTKYEDFREAVNDKSFERAGELIGEMIMEQCTHLNCEEFDDFTSGVEKGIIFYD